MKLNTDINIQLDQKEFYNLMWSLKSSVHYQIEANLECWGSFTEFIENDADYKLFKQFSRYADIHKRLKKYDFVLDSENMFREQWCEKHGGLNRGGFIEEVEK